MSSFLFLLIFLFSHCVSLYFQKSFQQPGDVGQTGNSSTRNHLRRYVQFSSFSMDFCSHPVSPYIFQKSFQQTDDGGQAGNFQHQEPVEKVCPVFFFVIHLLFVILVFSPCVSLIFPEVFSRSWWWRTSMKNHLRRYNHFLLIFYLLIFFVVIMCLPYLFRSFFSSLVMQGNQGIPELGSDWEGMSSFLF